MLKIIESSAKTCMKGPERTEQHRKNKNPRKKNMRVFYKLNVNENTNVTSAPHKEEYDDQNHIAIEDQETTL